MDVYKGAGISFFPFVHFAFLLRQNDQRKFQLAMHLDGILLQLQLHSINTHASSRPLATTPPSAAAAVHRKKRSKNSFFVKSKAIN